MELIDKDALMRTLGITDMNCSKCAWCDKEWSRCKRGPDFEDACCAIENAPTIEERKTGKWEDYHTTCSECGWQMIDDVTESPNMVGFNFCPNCGADMRESHCDDCRFYGEECVYCPVKQERRE